MSLSTETEEKKMTKKEMQELVNILGIETLEERKMDSLDFPEVAVWNIRWALERAYEMGFVKGVENGQRSCL